MDFWQDFLFGFMGKFNTSWEVGKHEERGLLLQIFFSKVQDYSIERLLQASLNPLFQHSE